MYGFAIIMGHLVGDFLLQNDWMALNKKKHTGNCLVHVGLYCCAIECFTAWPWWAILITFVCHFIQDRTNIITRWMDFNGQTPFRTGPCAPWSSIVVDNVWHLLQLYWTALLVG